MDMKFRNSIVGGTFDRFHLGHQKLLTEAFNNSEKVTVGIATEDLFGNKKLGSLIEDFSVREKNVYDFVSKNGWIGRYTSLPIKDIYGNSLEEKDIDAIFITEKTKENAQKINEEREKKGFKKLEIISVAFVLGDDNEIISSERIRCGMIDRKGKSYAKLFARQKQFVLPENAREDLRQPIGYITTDMHTVIVSLDQHAMLIAVGDIVALSAQQAGKPADITIIDGKTRRHTVEQEYDVSFPVKNRKTTENPAGGITQDAAKTIENAFSDYETTHSEQLIVVSGEEDLLAIPAILFAPLGSVVIYGQFDKGIVVTEVTEQNKKHVQNLFGKFQ